MLGRTKSLADGPSMSNGLSSSPLSGDLAPVDRPYGVNRGSGFVVYRDTWLNNYLQATNHLFSPLVPEPSGNTIDIYEKCPS
jgi:hypothetical protein